MLPIVHAYRDDGPMVGVTRWKPRKVYCTRDPEHADQPGQRCVVKFQQGREGVAALISEVVATTLLASAGFQTLNPVVVGASDGFARSCNANSEFPYRVIQGIHYGTPYRDDVVAGPPLRYHDLVSPVEVVHLWVADTWLANIDREVEGNTLLRVSSSGKFHLIASDQSDCFCGASTFCSDNFERTMVDRGTASGIPCLQDVLFHNGGPVAIRAGIRRVRSCVPGIGNVLSLIPGEWWQRSGIDHQAVSRILEIRADRLEQIMRPDHWEVPHGGTTISI